MAQRVEMGMYSFERGIIALHFGEKISKSPFAHFGVSMADLLYKFHL